MTPTSAKAPARALEDAVVPAGRQRRGPVLRKAAELNEYPESTYIYIN